MRLIALFFLLGTLLIQFFSQLPSLLWVVGSLFCSLITTIYFLKKSHKANVYFISLTAFLSGFLVASFIAHNHLNNQLPTQFEGKDIILQGIIHDIPNMKGDGTRFRFKILSALSTDELNIPLKIKGIIRLGWYQKSQMIHAGELWQLRVRLKRPSGFMNPGGFDYEKWLFTERIIATGYIRKSKLDENKRLAAAPYWSLNNLREKIHHNIQTNVENKSSAAILSALVVAVRTKLDDKQWQDLRLTGTSHLVAISGLHIAVVAGFALLPIMLLLRLFPHINERIPKRLLAGVVGVIFATIYAMLAGFTLPTQRALLMVVIATYGLVSRKNYSTSNIIAAALLGVLILDPLAGMTISFWLSFIAVGLILSFVKRQIIKPRYPLIKLQLVLSLGMLPFTLFFFGNISISSPIANLFAIPWVSLIIVPISLLALVFIPISSVISGGLFSIAALAIDWLFKGLRLLAESSLAEITFSKVPDLYLIIAFLGLLYLLFPKGFPAKWLGLVAFLPMLLFSVDRPKQGEFSYTLLDAGQGMASVLVTKNHSLIYDTGTRISDSFDIGKLVVLPYLKAKGIKHIDRMIISHEDIDHRGGAQAILHEIKVDEILSSDTDSFEDYTVKTCISGQKWKWDGIDFEILSPSLNYQQNDNNRSCVLRVSNAFHSILLTGDIERDAEGLLVSHFKDNTEKLLSEVLIVPHHGSKTSSTPQFLNAVSPDLALIPVGYRSRFGHPKPEIVERYNALEIKLMSTVSSGAITIHFPNNKQGLETSSYRQLNSRFWSRKD